MKHFIRVVAAVLMISMLSVTAFAAFTPSVEQKDEPTVVPPKTQVDGKPAIVVKDENGEVVSADAVEVLKVTPVSATNKDGELTEEESAVQEFLKKTYNEILKAKTLDVLVPELPAVLEKLNVKTPVNELVVQDLFNISLSEKLVKALEEKGNTVDISFRLTLEAGKQLIVLVQSEDGNWHIVSGDAIVYENGVVTISFPCVGNVCFIQA